jgi:hypothetical protein
VNFDGTIQAPGTIPAPATPLLVMAGIGAIAFVRRRTKSGLRDIGT